MGLDDASRNVESQPQPSSIVLADLPEALENTLEHRAGNALTGIFHRKNVLIARTTAANADPAAAGVNLIEFVIRLAST